MKSNIKSICRCLVLGILILLSSCEKLVQIDLPKTQLTGENIFTNDNTAYGAVVRCYTEFSGLFHTYASAGGELIADNATYRTGTGSFAEFSTNNISPSNTFVSVYIWPSLYNNIYNANRILEGVEAPNGLSPAARLQVRGEAKFIRALAYFYLVNMFGDVPLITGTNAADNMKLPRAAQQEVYSLITEDLKEAMALLKTDYVTGERVRPNKWAAATLLARAYLYTNRWAEAEAIAGEIILSGSYTLGTVNNSFLKNSTEAIFQLWQLNGFSNLGTIFIPSSATALPNTIYTTEFINSFQAGDQRRSNWIRSMASGATTYYSPFKYKQRGNTTGALAEYDMILRYAEVYLIRAEARARQNKLTEAISDVNMIRSRAGLANITTVPDQNGCLLIIEQERRHELFTEQAHRWFDLKRTGRINAVLGAKKSSWQPTDALLPIPEQELERNVNLTQNPGY